MEYDFDNSNPWGGKMKKCKVCGTPIIAHKNLAWPFEITDSYKCPNCGSEYLFKDRPFHYVLLMGLYFLTSSIIYSFFRYNLITSFVATILGFSFCFFTHMFLRTHMVFTNVILKSEDNQSEEKLIDQTRKWD
jgi:DNA-directed RNA polymerase subunit RPC12/RpoP